MSCRVVFPPTTPFPTLPFSHLCLSFFPHKLKPITPLCKQSAAPGGVAGEGNCLVCRCIFGFVGANAFVRRTNGERRRRWVLLRRKIHISSTPLTSQPALPHFLNCLAPLRSLPPFWLIIEENSALLPPLLRAGFLLGGGFGFFSCCPSLACKRAGWLHRAG